MKEKRSVNQSHRTARVSLYENRVYKDNNRKNADMRTSTGQANQTIACTYTLEHTKNNPVRNAMDLLLVIFFIRNHTETQFTICMTIPASMKGAGLFG